MNILNLAGYTLDFKGSLFFLIVLLAAALSISYFSYRRTLPPSGVGLRLTLGFLRFISLTVIILLIFEPNLTRQRITNLKPLLPVVVDDSESMKLKDRSGERTATIKALLQDPAWDVLSDRFELVFFAAGDSLCRLSEPSIESFHFASIGTDLSSFWQSLAAELEDESPAATLLISDGGDNTGRDPVEAARRSTAPIYTVGIGDTSQVRDARIISMIGNEVAYRGKESDLTVRIGAEGMENQAAVLELFDPEGKVLASTAIKLPPDFMEKEHTFRFSIDQVGLQPIKLRLTASGEELNSDNNIRTFPLEVKESRIRVLLLITQTNYESMFFERAVQQLKDIEVHSIQMTRRGIQAGKPIDFAALLAHTDVVVVMGTPPGKAITTNWNNFSGALASDPHPTWIWTGSSKEIQTIEQIIEDPLPFEWTKIRRGFEGETIPDRFYAVLDPDAEAEELALWWNLPPIQTPGLRIQHQGDASILIQLKDVETGESEGPLVLAWESQNKRNALSFGSGYWRWSFVGQTLLNDDQIYRTYIFRMIRWLATSPQKRPLHLSAGQKLYSSGEPVQIYARVLSGENQAVTSAQVEVTVEGPEGLSNLLLESNQYGHYSTVFQPETIGDYKVTGLAQFNEEIIGTDTISFTVEAYNIEKENLSQNYQLLQNMAEASGGEYLPADSLNVLPTIIAATPRIVHMDWNRRFFLNWDLWAILIIALSLEWFIRKRRGML
jgi:hypothetical protein